MSKEEDWETLVQDCIDRQSRLSEWETSFISSISEQLDQGRSLSPNQKRKLEQIWDDATEDG